MGSGFQVGKNESFLNPFWIVSQDNDDSKVNMRVIFEHADARVPLMVNVSPIKKGDVLVIKKGMSDPPVSALSPSTKGAKRKKTSA